MTRVKVPLKSPTRFGSPPVAAQIEICFFLEKYQKRAHTVQEYFRGISVVRRCAPLHDLYLIKGRENHPNQGQGYIYFLKRIIK